MRRRLSRSLVAIPVAYLVAAVVLGDLAPALDRNVTPRFGLDVDIDTARLILGATATGMIAFTALVVSSVLVVVQFAAGQYTPRLVLWFRRDPIVKHAIGSFLATFLFSLVALREMRPQRGDTTPDVTVAIALVLLIVATVLFLFLLERVMDQLRPRTLYGAIAREGIRAVHAIYPHALEDDERDDRGWVVAEPRVLAHRGAPGVIVSFDRAALLRVALAGDATIELLPGVGEFVAPGRPLVRVHGGAGVAEDAVRWAIDVDDERTIRQDPAFALRIIVDTALRALSPAVNDPTTAVQAVDAIELLVQELAGRELEAPTLRGPDGAVRVAWRSPSWTDMLELAFGEIRFYGAPSVQVSRRVRAALEDLRATTPPLRHAGLEAQLARLDAAVRTAHPAGAPEHAAALVADRIGLGLGR